MINDLETGINALQYGILHERVKKFIDKNCLIRNRVMPGKVPGTHYTWMFFLKNGLFNVDFLQAISTMFLYQVQTQIGHFNFQLTGLETASTPMLTAFPIFSQVYNIPLKSFSIRKEPKEYGIMNQIDGVVNPNLPCMIVDDLCNSSKSMKRAWDVLEKNNIPVLDYAFCIVNKVNKGIHPEERQSSDLYLPQNIKIIHLFDLDDFGLYDPSH